MPSYTTSDGTPFETSWTQSQVINWWTSRGVSSDVASQEATVDLLRYGDDLPRVLQSMLPHLLERSNTLLKTGQGTDSTTLNAPPQNLQPAPVASIITSMGASEPASATPTVGPIGLAYPDDPVNYSTMEVSPRNGYSSGGILPSGIYSPALAPVAEGAPMAMAAPAQSSNMMLYLILVGVAVGAYFLLVK
jgi:hypothetical protein